MGLAERSSTRIQPILSQRPGAGKNRRRQAPRVRGYRANLEVRCRRALGKVDRQAAAAFLEPVSYRSHTVLSDNGIRRLILSWLISTRSYPWT